MSNNYKSSTDTLDAVNPVANVINVIISDNINVSIVSKKVIADDDDITTAQVAVDPFTLVDTIVLAKDILAIWASLDSARMIRVLLNKETVASMVKSDFRQSVM